MTVESYLRDINALPMISPEEEAELAYKIQQGDEEACKRLVEAHLRFVVSVAKQYQSSGMDLCDLINEGNIGLMTAAKRFDPSRGFKFISYAVWWIRQNIMQAISEQGRMIRLPLNQIATINKINKTRAELVQKFEREPTDAELAEVMDLTPDKIGDAVSRSSRPLSFDVPFDDEDDGTLLDIVPDENSEQADNGLQKESLHSDLMDAMCVLTPREKQIVLMSFGIGCREMSLEEIGAQFDITRERARQLKEKAVRKLSRPAVKERLRQHMM